MKVAIGQDSHRFEEKGKEKLLLLGGVLFENEPGLKGNSDADVILHAITNAVSGITGINILGKKADDMCKNGILDSREYLKEALKYLTQPIEHLSISIEALTPKISPKIKEIRQSIAVLLNISQEKIGITATTGEGLTACGRGEGISVFVCLTVL